MKHTWKLPVIFLFIISLLVGCSENEPIVENTPSAVEVVMPSEEDVTDGESTGNPVESTQIIEVNSFDGYPLKGRLTLPEGEEGVSKLVIFVHGTGANTYENRFDFGDSTVGMFDVFIDEFSKHGISFFTYNQRGVHMSNDSPTYMEINEEGYKTYLPLNSVEDIYHMIQALREIDRLENSRVYLLGASEGALISSLFADKYPDMVDGIFLWGYMNDNLRETMKWQLSGGGMVRIFEEYFEIDELGRVSREAYEAVSIDALEEGEAKAYLEAFSFDDSDLNNNGYIEEEEMTAFLANIMGFDINEIIDAIESGDNEELANEFANDITIGVTEGWLLQHFSLRSNMEILPELDLPIYIFHGTIDIHTDVRGVYEIYEKFQELGKTNLTINVFQGHDHNLNIVQYFLTGMIPEGIQAIIDAIAEIE